MRFRHVRYKWISPSTCCTKALHSLKTHKIGQPKTAFKELIFELSAVEKMAKSVQGRAVCVFCFVCLHDVSKLSLENKLLIYLNYPKAHLDVRYPPLGHSK